MLNFVEFLNLMLTFPLTKLSIIEAELKSNNLFFSEDILVDVQLVILLLFLSNIIESSNEEKAKEFDHHHFL